MSSVNHIIIKYNRSNIKKGSRSLASKCPQIISVLSAPERDVTMSMLGEVLKVVEASTMPHFDMPLYDHMYIIYQSHNIWMVD